MRRGEGSAAGRRGGDAVAAAWLPPARRARVTSRARSGRAAAAIGSAAACGGAWRLRPHRGAPGAADASLLLPGIPAADQRVLFAGRQLTDADLLASEGVSDADTLHVLLRLLGGGKKRKKKTYTKPKKQKHKHKTVKLAVLKFFKVDDAGKVERLRQACPACGPATFMAKHFDRVYCGKCHVTYMVEGGAAGGAKKGKGKK